jgi:hypothetical protein
MVLTWIDYQLVGTTIIFILLGIGHNLFGRKAYVKGSTMKVFRENGNWIPDSAKELTLLGVFYMIAFSWWQSLIILIITVITENPLGIWIVTVSIIFEVPQVYLLRKYVTWNYEAIGVVLAHVVSMVIWLIPIFIA